MKKEGLTWLKRRRRVDEDSHLLRYDMKEERDDNCPAPLLSNRFPGPTHTTLGQIQVRQLVDLIDL